ncbi:hypothetical protein IW261DRAFT_1421263 [Armillaria novae-zelandiae]|uniref:Uncharacterized protein n=1 Tax=Armillaria novae-zelandiae TaxID=153914 RepID=A0AA39P3Z8_9AGAR|nr:hypothetical protein IW261DRAFT_1421263 [Armillaria novae-zelandiae]
MSTKAQLLDIKKAALSPFIDGVVGRTSSSSISRDPSHLLFKAEDYCRVLRCAHVPDGDDDDDCPDFDAIQQTSFQSIAPMFTVSGLWERHIQRSPVWAAPNQKFNSNDIILPILYLLQDFLGSFLLAHDGDHFWPRLNIAQGWQTSLWRSAVYADQSSYYETAHAFVRYSFIRGRSGISWLPSHTVQLWPGSFATPFTLRVVILAIIFVGRGRKACGNEAQFWKSWKGT